MAILNLKEFENKVNNYAEKLNVPRNLLPTFGYNEDLARPEIRVDGLGYHYVIIERGVERKHTITQDINEILYIIFSSVTHTMAFKYELEHRNMFRDSRKMAFKKQIELLSILNIDFANKKQNEIDSILRTYPFDDFAYIKVHFCHF